MKIREVPGYGEVEFPDSMTDEEINKAIANLAPKDQFEFEPAPPPASRSEAANRAEKMLYGAIGAGVGASGSALTGVGEAIGQARSARTARNIEEARKVAEAAEQSRIAAQRAAGIQVPEVVRNVPESSGAANWARKMSRDLPYAIAESAESMSKSDKMGAQALINRDIQAMEKIQGMGEGRMRLHGERAGQLMLSPEVIEELTAEKQAAQVAEAAQAAKAAAIKPATSPLEQVSQVFRKLMQTPVVRYGLPPVALGSAGMDIAEIAQQQRKQDPDRIRQLLSGLSAAGAGMSLFPPTAPLGVGLSVLAPAAQYIREQQKRPQMPSEPGLTAPEAAQYVSP
jgi:hypothetical protein